MIRKEKVDKYKQLNGNSEYKAPEIVLTQKGLKYLIDGHHRTVANFESGDEIARVHILINAESRLERLLERRAYGTVEELSQNQR